METQALPSHTRIFIYKVEQLAGSYFYHTPFAAYVILVPFGTQSRPSAPWPAPPPPTIPIYSLLIPKMEVIFDNKANVLNAHLHASHDNSIIYSISTSQTLWGRTYTYLRDTNPAMGGEATIVGAINWRKKTFEIQGQRKLIGDIRRKPKGFLNK